MLESALTKHAKYGGCFRPPRAPQECPLFSTSTAVILSGVAAAPSENAMQSKAPCPPAGANALKGILRIQTQREFPARSMPAEIGKGSFDSGWCPRSG